MLCSKSHTIGILTNLTIGRKLIEYDDSSLNILLDTSKLDSHKQENLQKGPIDSLQKAEAQTPYKCYFCISHPLSNYNARNCKKKQVNRDRDRSKQEPDHPGLLRQNLNHPGLTFLWLRRYRPAFACRAACPAPPTWPSTRSSPFSISGSAGYRQSHSLALTLFPRPVAL